MNKKIFSLLFAVAALALLASACETIPDDDGAKLNIALNVVQDPGALSVAPATAIQPKYHVKITLTNPAETFYAFDVAMDGLGYLEPIGLMVAASGSRVIDAEVYYIDGFTSVNSFPAQHYVTFLPAEMRTIELTGDDAKTVYLLLETNPNTGDVYGGGSVMISDGNSFAPIDFFRSCPPPSEFYANMVDLNWGGFQVFPEVPVDLSSGFQMYSLPAGHVFGFQVNHESSGLWGRTGGMIAPGQNPLSVRLGGYKNPFLELFPNSVTYGYTGNILWQVKGGWGGFGSGWPYTTNNDTCMGPNQMSSFYDGYTFLPTGTGSCRAEVQYVQDCRGVEAPSAGINIDIINPCGDGYCDPAIEDATTCAKDCFCGDGVCDNSESCGTCSVDCGGC